MWRVLRASMALVASGFFILVACSPPETVGLENPPCVLNVEPDSASTPTISVTPTFRVKFSKVMQPTTLTSEFIYLVRGQADYNFIRDLEAAPVSDSRIPFLVDLDIKAETIDENGVKRTLVTLTPKRSLAGEELYDLVLVRGLRDELRPVAEGDIRYTGSRPLNTCPAQNDIWYGDLASYRTGETKVFTYRTEIAPPRPGDPQIVEVMASPSLANGEYIEILNASSNESLDLCGLSIGKVGVGGRELAPANGGTCKQIPAGGYAVIVEPDYDFTGNPYQIPGSAVIFTIKQGGTTLFSGNLSSGDTVTLLDGAKELSRADPVAASGGAWPSTGKSRERCDNGTWQDKENGSPGRANCQ
ncbi:MAG: lamin tail domain-containing protein [Myxococcales bacterium]|nr:lamin tail domain-containing protein [Myxococcales bacterium]MCB9644912.1 lamin tail domain-containing protein [Myxococcales bacterium]